MHGKCSLVQYLVNHQKDYRERDLVSVKESENGEERWKKLIRKRDILKQRIKMIFNWRASTPIADTAAEYNA